MYPGVRARGRSRLEPRHQSPDAAEQQRIGFFGPCRLVRQRRQALQATGRRRPRRTLVRVLQRRQCMLNAVDECDAQLDDQRGVVPHRRRQRRIDRSRVVSHTVPYARQAYRTIEARALRLAERW